MWASPGAAFDIEHTVHIGFADILILKTGLHLMGRALGDLAQR